MSVKVENISFKFFVRRHLPYFFHVGSQNNPTPKPDYGGKSVPILQLTSILVTKYTKIGNEDGPDFVLMR